MSHQAHIHHWQAAMRCGLMGGRPFSEVCIKTYSLYIKWFIEQYGGLTVDHVKDVMLTVPVENFSKRLKIYEAVRCFARYLIEQEALDPRFLEQVRRFKPKRHIPARRYTVDEVNIERLLTVCDTPLDIIIVELLSQTGLRVSEACQLELGDINLEKGYLTVKRAKWGKTRRVGLTVRAQQAVQEYLRKRPVCETEHFLVTAKGRPISRYGARTRLEKLGFRLGIQASPHALRRAFVTINANKGRSLAMLQIACGHSDIKTTRSYCLTTEDEAIEAMQSWE